MPTSKIKGVAALAAALALSPALGCPSAAAKTATVTILGDSITAGYGLPARDALPARLQSELAKLGAAVRIEAAGVVGDTTAGGAHRVDRAARGADLCVVALGGNDLLRGADPAQVEANLDRIVQHLRARGVGVVLAGVRVPPVLQSAYAVQFNAAFAQVARRRDVLFVPDMLEGVLLNPRLNQSDGIHPNAAGVQVIAHRLAPVVAKGLATR